MKARWTLFCLTIFLSVSCATAPQHSVTTTNIKHDQIVVVGKVLIDPPIQEITFKGEKNPNTTPESEGTITKNDQTFYLVLTPSQDLSTVYFFAEKKFVANYTEIWKDKGTLDYAIPTETFLLPAPQVDVLYLNGFYYGSPATAYGGVYYAIPGDNPLEGEGILGTFPAPFTIHVPQGAKAIYIGTFAFTRNRFFEVTGFKHLDEYDEALVDFQKKFPGWELVRADVAPTKDDQK